MPHSRHDAPVAHVDLAEVRLAFARMPRQVQETGLPISAAASRLSRATVRVTVDNDTPAPYSSRNRSWMRVAACRCLRQVSRSSASIPSIMGSHSSITEPRRHLTGGLADRSSTLRYLRTVGSLTLSLRAIEAMDSPFLRRERIDCIWGMLIIAFPDLSRMELEAPSG